MLKISGGRFTFGSDDFYPEERPAHSGAVAAFEIDPTPVTNRAFESFVEETGYVTTAERPIEDYPGLSPAERSPGSIVFVATSGPVDLRDWRNWWRWVRGASWRHPSGPGSTIEGLEDHPVVQVSFFDAVAFSDWAGTRLPTEPEFEYAARAGRTTTYAWGDERDPGGIYMANTWQGRFPYENTAADGWSGTSPVGSFPPNDLGLYDTIGNVWEWTNSYFTPSHLKPDVDPAAVDSAAADSAAAEFAAATCCAPTNQDLANRDLAASSAEPGSTVPRRVIKGGSHLCAPEYCLRYRPSARSPQAEDSATNHIGFRCARDL